MRLAGSTVVITGASRGIGRATAVAVARAGATVGLLARDEADLKATLADAGGRGAAAAADVADTESLRDGLVALERQLGPTDVLVANAGIGAYGAFADVSEEEIEQIVRVNVLGTVHAVRAVVPGMIERRRGHLVIMGSIAGRIGSPFEAIYSATKFAVVGLAESLTVELEPYGIGVSMVNPGPVATHFGEARGHPYDRVRPKPVPAEQVAQAVVRAIEGDKHEQYVPNLFRQAVVTRHLLPPLFRWGSRKSFRREIARDVSTR